jgi:hypothetical protein
MAVMLGRGVCERITASLAAEQRRNGNHFAMGPACICVEMHILYRKQPFLASMKGQLRHSQYERTPLLCLLDEVP